MPQPASRPFNVLVAGDEPDDPISPSKTSETSSHTVTPVSDGRAAVAQISQNASRYSQIVGDLQLTGVDGLGVSKA